MTDTQGVSIYPLGLVRTCVPLVVKYLNVIDIYLILQSQVKIIESCILTFGNKIMSVTLKRYQDKPNQSQAEI